MTIYAIGDVQGCYDELMHTLDYIHFDDQHDILWFAGDLVNRGTQSVEVLRFVRNLGDRALTVLGNHDLHLLALANGCYPEYKSHTLDDVLNAPDRDELLEWLRYRPFIHHDQQLSATLVHAGIPPQWSLGMAFQAAYEIETYLQDTDYTTLLKAMYGDSPTQWHDELEGEERYRYIINAFTRMRFVTDQGALDFEHKGEPGSVPDDLIPWYAHPDRQTQLEPIIFGHWSALRGETGQSDAINIDGGCIWGGQLIALQLN